MAAFLQVLGNQSFHCGVLKVLFSVAYVRVYRIEDFQHCFQTNTLGPIKCIRGVLPTMRAQKSGTIINHGSVLGTIGSLGSGAYAVSKFGLDGVSENCAVELARTYRSAAIPHLL